MGAPPDRLVAEALFRALQQPPQGQLKEGQLPGVTVAGRLPAVLGVWQPKKFEQLRVAKEERAHRATAVPKFVSDDTAGTIVQSRRPTPRLEERKLPLVARAAGELVGQRQVGLL